MIKLSNTIPSVTHGCKPSACIRGTDKVKGYSRLFRLDPTPNPRTELKPSKRNRKKHIGFK